MNSFKGLITWTSLACMLAALLVALTASISFAQLPTGTILGTVKDPTGQVVPGTKLTARNLETGQTRAVTTADDGSYRMSALPIGNYEIRADRDGFETEVISGITLAVGQEAVENFTLRIGSVSQTISVTAEAPLVNTTSGSLAALVDEQKIADLPLNGRNYIDLMLLQPGIAQETNKNQGGTQIGTWFSSNGAPVRSNSLLLDGAITTNLYGAGSSSASGSTLGIDGIREWRVVTNSFSAEYGMTMGSQMLIASKGGTNTYHGSAFEYLRNDTLDATNYFYVPVAANGFRRIPPYKRNNFGGSFGGPVKKDKTFFYGVYEGLRERLGVTTIDNVFPASDHVIANNPGCNGCTVAAVIQPLLALYPNPNLPKNQFTYPFTQPTNESYGQIRIDQDISAADSLFGRYTIDDSQQLQTAGYPQFTTTVGSRNQFLTVSEDHIFSTNVLNTARISFSRTNIGSTDPPSGLEGPGYTFVPGFEIGDLTIGGVSLFGTNSLAPAVAKQNIFTYSDDVFVTHGKHALKFGVLINHFQQYMTQTKTEKGNISFADINHFLLAEPSSYTTQTTPGSIISKTYHFSTFGFYAQDDFRLRSNLTLNLGLRYEFSNTVTETHGLSSSFHNIVTDAAPTVGPPFRNPSLHNFSPRLGFAWDVRGDGRTAVHGGFGLLYDVTSIDAGLSGSSFTPPFTTSSTVSFPATNPVILSLPLVFPVSAAGKSLAGVNWNMQQPKMLQYNLAVERQLPASMSLTVAYAGSRGMNLLQITEGNPTIPQILADGQPFWTGTNPRLNPNWTTYTELTTGADSSYNSMQVQLLKRLKHGLEVQGSFTWSKVLDDGQGEANGENTSTPVLPEYPQDLALEHGPASFDIPKNFRLNAIYQFPDFHRKEGVLGSVLSGWGVTGILTAESGYPFTPVLQTNRSRSGVNGGAVLNGVSSTADRPNLVPGVSLYSVTHGVSRGCGGIPAGTPLGTPSLYFDPCAFSLQTVGTLGDMGRDSLRGPGLTDLDFSIIKDTPLRFREGAMLEFRAELFNSLNHPNFVTPMLGGKNNNTANIVYAGTVTDVTENPLPTAGVLTATSNTAREIQLALKVIF